MAERRKKRSRRADRILARHFRPRGLAGGGGQGTLGEDLTAAARTQGALAAAAVLVALLALAPLALGMAHVFAPFGGWALAGLVVAAGAAAIVCSRSAGELAALARVADGGAEGALTPLIAAVAATDGEA